MFENIFKKEPSKACLKIARKSTLVCVFWLFLRKTISYEINKSEELIKNISEKNGSNTFTEHIQNIEKEIIKRGDSSFLMIIEHLFFHLQGFEKEIIENKNNSEVEKDTLKYFISTLDIIIEDLNSDFLKHIFLEKKIEQNIYKQFYIPFIQEVFRIYGVVMDIVKT